MDVCRPSVLNGIPDLAARGDLVQRSLLIECPPIMAHSRREEAELNAAFELHHASILGALCDGLVACIRDRQTVSLRLKTKPRMADFATWASGGC